MNSYRFEYEDIGTDGRRYKRVEDVDGATLELEGESVVALTDFNGDYVFAIATSRLITVRKVADEEES